MSDAYVPEPMTCHPHYEGQADAIRSGFRLGHIAVSRARALVADQYPSDPVGAELPPVVLTVRKFSGPAPFVGDPLRQDAHYVWLAAIDNVGRHVAGESTLEFQGESSPYTW